MGGGGRGLGPSLANRAAQRRCLSFCFCFISFCLFWGFVFIILPFWYFWQLFVVQHKSWGQTWQIRGRTFAFQFIHDLDFIHCTPHKYFLLYMIFLQLQFYTRNGLCFAFCLLLVSVTEQNVSLFQITRKSMSWCHAMTVITFRRIYPIYKGIPSINYISE